MHFDFSVRIAHNSRRDIRGAFNELQSLVGPEHAYRLGQAIGGDAFGRDNIDQTVIGQANAGMRINDVRVAFAADFQALIQISGGRNRYVLQREISHRWRVANV